MDKNLKRIIILIAILIIIAVILAIFINILGSRNNDEISSENATNTANETSNAMPQNVISDEEIAKTRDDVLSSKTETSRIKAYVGQFFSTMESGEYQKAYNMLFDSFKSNYFPTEEQFEQYAVNKYPENIVLNYINVDREGTIYVLTIEVIDGLNKANSFEQKIVIEENELNDFNISFQMD